MKLYIKRNGKYHIDILSNVEDYDVVKSVYCKNADTKSLRDIADKLMQVYELFVGDTLIEVTKTGTKELGGEKYE